MKLLICTILMIVSFWSSSQNKSDYKKVESSSKVIKAMSGFWRIDSLANNGYRACAAERLLKTQVDTVTVEVLTAYFGKPNSIWSTNKGTEYIYNCYDSKKDPREKDHPFDCVFISFLFA